MDLPLLITSRDKTLRAMQEIQLEGLKEIDRICRKHNIEYSLGGGTCLGQVRHGGFIPWDDDVDVDMTADNYDKFMAVVPEELDHERFFLACRTTEPRHYRASARLGIRGTRLSTTRWDLIERESRVFVDIFRWNYLPDDEKKRKKIASKLFYIHCMQNYKEHGGIANKIPQNRKLLLNVMAAIVPAGLLQKYEDRLIHYTGGKTGWIMDDAIIHGDYGGYKADGIDEYKDVQFEGLTVRNKKDPDNFLRVAYSDNYMDWLPPAKRISHHGWTNIDLGKYAEKYGLSEDYKDFMTIRLTPPKLRQMKIVTDMMLQKICEICDKHDINYAVADLTHTSVDPSIDTSDLWIWPGTVLMLREDYDKFGRICQDEFGKQYFYQTHETEPNYFYDYARVCLNTTQLIDRRIRPEVRVNINAGFFVNILPLDNYVKDDNTKTTMRNLRFWRRYLWIRWMTNNRVVFLRRRFKDKVKLILLHGIDTKTAFDKVSDLASSYKDRETDLCFDSSHQLEGSVFKKNDILNKKIVKAKKESYKADTLDELIERINGRWGSCFLTYYDDPDRQLSILRYDEKTGELLTNEEIISRL